MKYKLKENKNGELFLKNISAKIPEKEREKFFRDMEDGERPISIGIRKDKEDGYRAYVTTKNQDGEETKKDISTVFIPGLPPYSGYIEKSHKYIGKTVARLVGEIALIDELPKKERAKLIVSCMESVFKIPDSYQGIYLYNNEHKHRMNITEAFTKEIFEIFVGAAVKAKKYDKLNEDISIEMWNKLTGDAETAHIIPGEERKSDEPEIPEEENEEEFEDFSEDEDEDEELGL